MKGRTVDKQGLRGRNLGLPSGPLGGGEALERTELAAVRRVFVSDHLGLPFKVTPHLKDCTSE